jgi:hypothetical protein
MEKSELNRYRGHNVRVTCTDGQVLEGWCSIVTQAPDNDPEVASIVIERENVGLTEILLPEIQSIVVE